MQAVKVDDRLPRPQRRPHPRMPPGDAATTRSTSNPNSSACVAAALLSSQFVALPAATLAPQRLRPQLHSRSRDRCGNLLDLLRRCLKPLEHSQNDPAPVTAAPNRRDFPCRLRVPHRLCRNAPALVYAAPNPQYLPQKPFPRRLLPPGRLCRNAQNRPAFLLNQVKQCSHSCNKPYCEYLP